ncbi:MAG TPA: hypothetical protein VLC09_10250 [Polyangiaceae bacterium]|nr:hypothetical protein [Polyangiaceae bacterium]
MRRALLTGIASLLAVALIAPAAQAATQVRELRVSMNAPDINVGSPPPGTLTLDFIFKNTRSNKKRFTPRQLIKIDLSKVPLTCENGHTAAYSQFLFTQTFATKVEVTKIPNPHPKPGRYAFRFAYSFPTFNGTISGTISKTTGTPKPRPVTSHGHLNIWDLDADPGHSDCTNFPPVGGVWGGGVPVVPV